MAIPLWKDTVFDPEGVAFISPAYHAGTPAGGHRPPPQRVELVSGRKRVAALQGAGIFSLPTPNRRFAGTHLYAFRLTRMKFGLSRFSLGRHKCA
jgi:hypothetical protein